jgi:hypothetical protein
MSSLTSGCPTRKAEQPLHSCRRGEWRVVLAEDGEPITTSSKERELVLGNADLTVFPETLPAGNNSRIAEVRSAIFYLSPFIATPLSV